VNYRTTCPQCASVFRLGADQLDAAQGWVQCSVCGAAFDARLSLLMEDGSPLPPVSEPEPLEAPTSPEAAQPAELEAAEAEPATAAETPAAVPGAEDVAVTDTPRGIAQREVTLDLPSIILIDPDFRCGRSRPLPAVPPCAGNPPRRLRPHTPLIPVARRAALAWRTGSNMRPLRPARRARVAPRRIMHWVWGAASALLGLLLLAQTTYYLRDTLVSRLPQTRPTFEQACAVLGCTLSLPKNLALLQIVGSDLQTEASGRLKLTLTLGNRAGHAQAWPVLVLTLTDQRNRPLARRSFAPSEYLGDAQRIAAGIPPGSEQALSLPLTVHDLAPMGFDVQLAY
jgi:predicted Zn finger-like uncharacterized protein